MKNTVDARRHPAPVFNFPLPHRLGEPMRPLVDKPEQAENLLNRLAASFMVEAR